MVVEIHLLIGSLVMLFVAGYLAVAQNRGNLPKPSGLINPQKGILRKEKRIFPRYRTLLRTKYKTPLEEGISWIKDISRGGVRLFLNNIPVGTVLAMEINLPYEQKSIFAQGSIVWTRSTDSGINFGAVEQDDLSRIIQYIGLQEQIRSSRV